MYLPEHFSETSIDRLHQYITQHPFGTLITQGVDGLDANHIPFELAADEGDMGALHAHVARANPLWQAVTDSDEVLVIFHAGDAYISPNWYPSKHEFHQQVPTWNYIVVHVHGTITVHDDEQYVRGIVARLTHRHEAKQSIPWKMSDAPKDYIDAQIASIVGLKIQITRLTGKSKLGQNKEARDIRGASEALKSEGSLIIADAMLASALQKTDS